MDLQTKLSNKLDLQTDIVPGKEATEGIYSCSEELSYTQ